jgi:hypothetical protein
MSQTPVKTNPDSTIVHYFIESMTKVHVGYTYYTTEVVLRERPEGWSESRIGYALIDYLEHNYAPFGGSFFQTGPNTWIIKVFTD